MFLGSPIKFRKALFSEVESRTQGSRPRPRPRTQKNPRPRTALSRTDPLEAKDRNARGQGQGPRKQAPAFSEKKRSSKIFFNRSQKKKFSKTFFRRSPIKHVFQNFFLGDLQKIQLFKKMCCLRDEDGAIFEDLRPRPRT